MNALQKCRRFATGILLSLLAVAANPCSSSAMAPITLGDAKGYLILSTNGNTKLGNVTIAKPASPDVSGDLGGITVTLGGNSAIAGDAIASNDSGIGISLGNYTKVRSTCITNASAVHLGAGSACIDLDESGYNFKIQQLTSAGSDAISFSNTLASAPVDQALPAIDLPASHSQTLTCEGSWLNVFSVPSIKLGSSSRLIIDCALGDIVVINVPGSLTLGSGARISLIGGIAADAVAFNITGSSSSPALVSGASSVLNGTFVAAQRSCQMATGVTIKGQLVCGGDVTIGANLKASYFPFIPF
jgi:choice-of-anchor A domain-containing protein